MPACPRCGGNNTAAKSTLSKLNVKKVDSLHVGGSVVGPAAGMSESQQYNEFIEKMTAPPRNKIGEAADQAAGCGILLGLVSSCVLFSAANADLKIVAAILLAFVALWLFLGHKARKKAQPEYDRQLAIYNAEWLCLQCSNVFTPVLNDSESGKPSKE